MFEFGVFGVFFFGGFFVGLCVGIYWVGFVVDFFDGCD